MQVVDNNQAYNEYTVQEACDILKKSRATIYNWIASNKLQWKDTENGKVILLSNDEIRNIQEYNNAVLNSNNLNTQESKLDSNHILFRILDQNQELQSKLVEYNEKLLYYSEQVGQVKLLTDNNKFYQDKYFELKYELDSKLDKIRQLELELESLKNRNNVLETNNQEYITKLQEAEAKIKQLELSNAELEKELQTEKSRPFWKKKIF